MCCTRTLTPPPPCPSAPWRRTGALHQCVYLAAGPHRPPASDCLPPSCAHPRASHYAPALRRHPVSPPPPPPPHPLWFPHLHLHSHPHPSSYLLPISLSCTTGLMPSPTSAPASAMAAVLAGAVARVGVSPSQDAWPDDDDPYDPTRPAQPFSLPHSRPVAIELGLDGPLNDDDPHDPHADADADAGDVYPLPPDGLADHDAFDYSDGEEEEYEYEYGDQIEDPNEPFWPYIPPQAYGATGPVPYPPEHGEALLADALAAGWPLPADMTAPDLWALGAPVVPGITQLSLPCELAAEASLALHEAQTAAFDKVRQERAHRHHFSIPDVFITPDPEDGGDTIAEVTVPPQRRRSVLFSEIGNADAPEEGSAAAALAALAHGRGTQGVLPGLVQDEHGLSAHATTITTTNPAAFEGDWDSTPEQSADSPTHECDHWIAAHELPPPSEEQAAVALQHTEEGEQCTPRAQDLGPCPYSSNPTTASAAAVFASWAQADGASLPSASREVHVTAAPISSNPLWAPTEHELEEASGADLALVPSRRAPPPPSPPMSESEHELSAGENVTPTEPREIQLPSPSNSCPDVTQLVQDDVMRHSTSRVGSSSPTVDAPRCESGSSPAPLVCSGPSGQHQPSSHDQGVSTSTSSSSLNDVFDTPHGTPTASVSDLVAAAAAARPVEHARVVASAPVADPSSTSPPNMSDLPTNSSPQVCS